MWYVDCYSSFSPGGPLNSYGPGQLREIMQIAKDVLSYNSGIEEIRIVLETVGCNPMSIEDEKRK